MKIYAGFDCGGSSSRCLLTDENGNQLGIGKGGPSNYISIGKELARNSMETAIAEAFAAAGLKPQAIEGAFVASAAVEVFEGALHESFFRSVTGCEKTACDNDIIPVWYAGGEPGKRFEPAIAMIAGTGAVTYLLKDQAYRRVDGWGPLLGDDGSGCSIGLAALRKFVRMEDHRLEMDAEFYRTVLDFYGLPEDQPRQLLPIAYGEDKFKRIASVTRVLEDLYLSGNPTVNEIYRNAAKELALSCRTVLGQESGSFRLVLSGGILQNGRPLQRLLAEELRDCDRLEAIIVPEMEAVVSAASIALRNAGREEAAEKMMRKES